MPARPRFPRVVLPLCAVLLGSCGDGPTDPARGQPGVRAVMGANVTDTIEAQPLQALIVEVRGPSGALESGIVVRFQAKPVEETTSPYYEPTMFVCPISEQTCGIFGGAFTTDTTDADGRAKVSVRMGRVAGAGVVRLTVPEFGYGDSASYTISPGAPANVYALAADTSLDIGETAMLRGRVVDRYYNPRTEVPTVSAGIGSAIAVETATGVVTAREMGTQSVISRYGTFIDSTSVSVVPTGRLLVWSSYERVVRLVDINGRNERTIVSNVSSDLGAFPQFDPTRQRITLHAGTESYGGPPNNIIVIDTTTSPRRDIGPATGLSMVMSTRHLADGTVLAVALRPGDEVHPGYSLWRVATDNAVTFVAAVPGLESTYGGADISHDGTRIAYIAGAELRVLDAASGSTTLLAASARAPRWSFQDDRIAYLFPVNGSYEYDGVVRVINSDGTGMRGLGSHTLSPGLGWSPDGRYVVGRSSGPLGLRLLRVGDGVDVLLRFNSPGGAHDYWQPDWR